MTPYEIKASNPELEETCLNTDRELWREPRGDAPSDYYANSIHVTEAGGIGIDVGGTVIVRSLAEWHASVEQLADRQDGIEQRNAELEKQAQEIARLQGELHNRRMFQYNDVEKLTEQIKAERDKHAENWRKARENIDGFGRSVTGIGALYDFGIEITRNYAIAILDSISQAQGMTHTRAAAPSAEQVIREATEGERLLVIEKARLQSRVLDLEAQLQAERQTLDLVDPKRHLRNILAAIAATGKEKANV